MVHTPSSPLDRAPLERESGPLPQSPTPRAGVLSIEPYVGGKSKVAGAHKVHKLSSNESALGASPLAIEAFETASQSLHLYPDGGAGALRDKIAQIHQIQADRVICGAGSDEILQLLCRAYLGDGDNIVQSEHGFLVYALAARACGADIHFAPEKNLCTDVDAILAKVDARTRLVFLANPNNPTGSWLPHTEILRLHRELRPDIVLVLDAAYAEYMADPEYDDGIDLVTKHANVIVTRTFSKIYGLGGLRLGWAYGPAAMIDALNRIRGPFNVSAAAQITGIAALEDQDFVARNRAHNDVERAAMRQRLGGMGLEVHPSAGNFLLVRFPEQPGLCAGDIQSWLMSKGVIVREMTAYRLPNHLRISIGAREANQTLLDLLAEKFQAQSHEQTQ